MRSQFVKKGDGKVQVCKNLSVKLLLLGEVAVAREIVKPGLP